MTKPTPVLDWWPDPVNPLAARALWTGAGWHYRLDWGHLDQHGRPATDRVTRWQVIPVRHVWPAAGTYTVTGTPELANATPVRMQVTVRPEMTPQAELDDLGAGQVRLRLVGGWPGEVWHRVRWDNHTPPQDYTGTQLTPEYIYPPGTDRPLITVTDMPARRQAWLVGPTVPPEPNAPLEFAWNPTETDRPPGGRGGEIARTLRVWGLTPGAQWRALMPWRGAKYATLTGTADEHGQTTMRVWMVWPQHASWRPRWLSTTVAELDEHNQPARWVHCPYRLGDHNTGLVPIYDWDDTDPQAVSVRELWPPQAGTYTVDFGDNTNPVHVDCDGVTPWRAAYRYTDRTPVTLTVTAPDGTTATRRIAPVTLHGIEAWRAAVLTEFGMVRTRLRPAPGDDEYQQVRMWIDVDAMPTQSYAWSPTATPPDRETQFMRDVWADKAGQTYDVWAGSAFTDPITAHVHISPPRTKQPPRPPNPDPDREHRKDTHMPQSYPPNVVPEGYVNPDEPVGIRLLHLPTWVENVTFTSEAFTGGKTVSYPATIQTDAFGSYATATVPIGTVDPATYDVEAHLNEGSATFRRWLLVEQDHDGEVFVAADRSPKPGEYVKWQFNGLTRNAAWAYAHSPLFVGSEDLKTVDIDGETYQAIIYHVGSDNAHQGFMVSDNAKPGTYPVKVAQEFQGGHREIITGEFIIPPEGAKAGKPQFTIVHKVNLAKLGNGDTIIHKIPFGEKFLQTNTGYAVLDKFKTIDPATGEPVKPTLEEANELALLNSYHFDRETDRVELYTRNPHKLRSNTRFQVIYIVTIFPVVDDGAGYNADNPGDDVVGLDLTTGHEVRR